MSNINDYVEYHQNFLETLSDLVLDLDEELAYQKAVLKNLESTTNTEQDVWVLTEQYNTIANLIRYRTNLIETIDCILNEEGAVARLTDRFFMEKKREETHFKL